MSSLNTQPDRRGPASIRTSRKASPSLTALRDVNRCSVRPLDLVIHQGFAALVTDTRGEIGSGIEGFYLHQTRFLSRLRIAVDGSAPKFVSANSVDHHSIIAYHLAPSPLGVAAGPDRDKPGASPGEVAQKAIELQVNLFVGGGLHIEICAVNHGLGAAAEVEIALEMAADFADLNEALEGHRKQTAAIDREWSAAPGGPGGVLALSYRHPRLQLGADFAAGGGDGWRMADDRLVCRVSIPPQSPRLLTVDVSPRIDGKSFAPFYGVEGAFDADALPARSRREWAEGCAEAVLSDAAAQGAWDQAVSDLASLQTGEGRDCEPAMIVAGMPNYSGLFGRDGYLTALQTATLNPATLRGALEVLTPFNAGKTDDFRDAEPGKVLHQRQRGPLARLDLSPFLAYYGDHSAPGLFLLAAARHFAQTGDAAFLGSLKGELERTLDWMAGNADELGFYPYQTRSRLGVKNQSWKDSGEAVLYPDGSNVADPIAMADIQGLYYAGQQALGLALCEIGDAGLGERCLASAARLKQRFNATFWMPDLGFFAIALDADKKPVRSIASDPGSCLAYGIIDDDKTEAVADRLLAPDMFSGWGIRTLSSLHPAFNPFAYHLGTVWPSPNAVTAFGLRRYGFRDHFYKLARGLFDATQVFDLDRLPEVFGGHARDARHPHPGLYPGACSPQAWSAGAVALLVDCMLGITPMASRGLVVVDPELPPWLTELTIRNIRVGEDRLSLRCRSDSGGSVKVDVLACEGLAVTRLRDLPAGRDRLAAAVRSAIDPGLTTVLAHPHQTKTGTNP